MDKAERDELRAEHIRKMLVRAREVYGHEVNKKEEQPRIEFNGIKMKCPNCGEYMVHDYVPELEAFTFACKRCGIAAAPKPLTLADLGLDSKPPKVSFGESGWKHFIEPGETDG